MRLMIREPDIRDEELAEIHADTLIVAGQHDLIRKSETDHIASKTEVISCIVKSWQRFSWIFWVENEEKRF